MRNYTFQGIDRFSIDFCAESKAYRSLQEYFGVVDDLALMERLHVDFRYSKPRWIGFLLVDEQGRSTDYFGIPRAGEGDFGYSLEHPLANARTAAEVDAYPKWPTPDIWDYDAYAVTARVSTSTPCWEARGVGSSRPPATWSAWIHGSCFCTTIPT